MYHCHLRFYFVGCQGGLFRPFREAPPLEPFSHEFLMSDELDPEKAAKADCILADLRGLDAVQAAKALLACK